MAPLCVYPKIDKKWEEYALAQFKPYVALIVTLVSLCLCSYVSLYPKLVQNKLQTAHNVPALRRHPFLL